LPLYEVTLVCEQLWTSCQCLWWFKAWLYYRVNGWHLFLCQYLVRWTCHGPTRWRAVDSVDWLHWFFAFRTRVHSTTLSSRSSSGFTL